MTTGASSLFPMFCFVDNAAEVLDLTLDLCRVVTPRSNVMTTAAAKNTITPFPFMICSYPVEEVDDDDDEDDDVIYVSGRPLSRTSTPPVVLSLPLIRASSLSTATTVTSNSIFDFYFPEEEFDVGSALATTFVPTANKKRTHSPPPTDIFRIPTNQIHKKVKTHNEGKSLAEKRGGLVRMSHENYVHRSRSQPAEERQQENSGRMTQKSNDDRRPMTNLARTSDGELKKRIPSAMAA
jgi:hypothetical protein